MSMRNSQHNNALFSIAAIRCIEQNSRLIVTELMQRAAAAIVARLSSLLGEEETILFLAGPGHNGGDTMIAAHHFAQMYPDISVELAWIPGHTKRSLLSEIHQKIIAVYPANFRFHLIEQEGSHPLLQKKFSWIVDGLFGIGLSKPITGIYRQFMRWARMQQQQGSRVLAVDIPSGLNADTGDILTPDIDTVIPANYTVTFIGLKPGLYTGFGRDVSGKIYLESLNLPADDQAESSAQLNTPVLFHSSLPQRRHSTHKGDYGHAAIIGGTMPGAAFLAGRSALFSGAGKVSIGFLQPQTYMDYDYPELIITSAEALLAEAFDVVLIGPGLGKTEQAQALLLQVLTRPCPCVLDADALNLIAENQDLMQGLRRRRHHAYLTVMTPHPLEAARLLKITATQVNQNRLQSAQNMVQNFADVAVLKGSGTIIAQRPDASAQRLEPSVVINPIGNPGLASAGTGDVLAGVITAFLSQSMPIAQSCYAAVYLHAEAADDLVARAIGPVGLNASALPSVIRQKLNHLLQAQ